VLVRKEGVECLEGGVNRQEGSNLSGIGAHSMITGESLVIALQTITFMYNGMEAVALRSGMGGTHTHTTSLRGGPPCPGFLPCMFCLLHIYRFFHFCVCFFSCSFVFLCAHHAGGLGCYVWIGFRWDHRSTDPTSRRRMMASAFSTMQVCTPLTKVFLNCSRCR